MSKTKLEDLFGLNQGAQPPLHEQPNTLFQEIYFEPVPDALNYALPIVNIMNYLKSSGMKTKAEIVTITNKDNQCTGFGLAFETPLPIATTKEMDRILGNSLREHGFVPDYKITCQSKNIFRNYNTGTPNPPCP